MPQRDQCSIDVDEAGPDHSPHGSPPVDLSQYAVTAEDWLAIVPDKLSNGGNSIECTYSNLLSPSAHQLSSGRPEYHLLPHSVAADSPHHVPEPAPPQQPLPEQALLASASSSASSVCVRACSSGTAYGQSSNEELLCSGSPSRVNRRIVCYSRSGLPPVIGDPPPERSSSIPVHLDQISKEPSKEHGGHTAQQRRILACLSIGELLLGCCWVVLVPLFPAEAQSRGIGESVVGFVFSCYALTLLIMTPITNRLIQRCGMTQVLCSGLCLTGVATVAFGAVAHVQSTSTFVWLCLAVRVLSAVGASMYVTASLTFIANRFSANMNYVVGVVETCSAVGMSIGPAIGGALGELGGYGLAFYVVGAATLAVCCLTVWLMPVIKREPGPSRDVVKLARQLLRSVDVWLCMFALLTISIDYSAIEPGIQPYAHSTFGATQSQTGLYFLVASGAYALVSILWGRLSDLASNCYIQIAACTAGSALSLLLMAPGPHLHPLQPRWWLLGLGMTLNEVFTAGAFIPLFSNMLNAVVAEGMEDNISTQSLVSSLWWAIFSAGSVLGPAFYGVVTEACGFPTLTTCVAALTAVCAVLSLLKACWSHCRCGRALRHRLLGRTTAEERRPLLDGRERRASV